MKSKTSLFNKGIQKQNVKQHGWIGIIYLVGLLFALPLQMVLYASDERRVNLQPAEDLFDISFPPQLLFVLGIPVLTGIFLFRYLQVSAPSDTMHSLPIKRGTLFVNQLFSGAVMLLLPVWVTAALASVVASIYPAFENISAVDIGAWTGSITVMTLFYFGFSVFVAMITGLSVAQGILTIILLILPAGLFHLVYVNLDMFLYGFSPSYYSSESITRWSPVVMMAEWNHKDIITGEVFLYLFLTIAFSIIAHVLYRARHTEMATQAITFQPLRPVFKYGVAFCTMLVGGIYFQQYNSTGWLIFGYIFGSLAGYLLAEMILKKTWRIWNGKTFISYAGYAVVIIIIAVVVKTDMIGYASNIPAEDQVESVHFGHSVHPLTSEESSHPAIFTSNREYIQKVREFHTEIVQKRPEEVNGFNGYRSTNDYVIAYQLENGSTVVRQYRLPINAMKEQLAGVMESEQYKRQRFHLDQLNQSMEEIEIRPHGPVRKKAVITDQQEIKELRQILKYEIASMTIEEMMEEGKVWATITAELAGAENNTRDRAMEWGMPWKKSFDELENWLDEKGYLDEARILPEDIEKAEVLHVDGGITPYNHPSQIFAELDGEQAKQVVEIKNKKKIEKVLEQYSEVGEGEYVLRFTTEDQGRFFGVLTRDQLPEEVVSR